MKKIKGYIVLFTCCLLLNSGCDKWLDVKPYDKISEDELFTKESGFQKLLNGIYISLNEEDLYGKALTVEMLEVMSGIYEIGSDPVTWGEYRDLADHNYATAYWRGRFDKVWERTYALISNSNILLDEIKENEGLFTGDNLNIIKGEALAIRAMLHFDMLRMFGPVISTNPENESIPYYKTQTLEIGELLSADKVLDNIIADLLDAQEALKNDPIIKNGGSITSNKIIGENFLEYRTLRLNYFAVQALLARVYLYAGDKTNALIYANKLIIAADNGLFSFVDNTLILGSPENPDRIFSSEIIFGLTNNKRNELFKDNHDPNKYPGYAFTMHQSLLKDYIYGGDLGGGNVNDYRYVANWKSANIGLGNDGAKMYCYKYMDIVNTGLVRNTIIPMVRLSEMYLIAAECQPELIDGLEYVNLLRSKRGVPALSKLKRSGLTNEYIREMFAEGQLFYYYKRANTYLRSTYDDDLGYPEGARASDKIFVVPLPDTEKNNR